MKYKISGKLSDGPVSRYINRPISMRITSFVLHIWKNASPNIMTIIAFLIGILSAMSYLFVGPLIAGIAVQIASIIDGVDGEIARALKKRSSFGAFLDSMLDRFVDIAIIICITVYLARSQYVNMEVLSLVSLLALSGTILVSYARGKSQQLFGENPEIERMNFATRDVRLFIIFLGSILGFLLETLILLAIMTYLQVLARMCLVAKYYKTISRQSEKNIETADFKGISKVENTNPFYDLQQAQLEDF